MSEVQTKTDQTEQAEQKWHVPKNIQGLVKQASNELGEDISDTIADMCKSGFYFKPLPENKKCMKLDESQFGAIVNEYGDEAFNAIVAMESLNCRIFTPEENRKIFHDVCIIKGVANPDKADLYKDVKQDPSIQREVNDAVRQVKDHYANANKKVPAEYEKGGRIISVDMIVSTIYSDLTDDGKKAIIDGSMTYLAEEQQAQKEQKERGKSLSEYKDEANKLNKDRVPVGKNDKTQGKDELSH